MRDGRVRTVFRITAMDEFTMAAGDSPSLATPRTGRSGAETAGERPGPSRRGTDAIGAGVLRAPARASTWSHARRAGKSGGPVQNYELDLSTVAAPVSVQ